MTNTTGAFKIGVSISSGSLATASVFSWEKEFLYLALVGLIISTIGFLYDESHKVKSETKMKLLTKLGKYLLFGATAFPSVYVAIGLALWAFPPFQALCAIAVTFSIVKLVDAGADGITKKLQNGEKPW